MQDEHTPSRVGDRIRRVVVARGQSLRAFATQADIPYRSLQDYVAGKNRPGFDQLQKMASIGVDVSFLLTGVYGGGIIRSFTGQVDRSALLSSDREVAKLVFDGALEAANALSDHRLSSGEPPLDAKGMLEAVVYALSLSLSVASEMDDALSALRRQGASARAVTGVVLDAVAAALKARAPGDPPS